MCLKLFSLGDGVKFAHIEKLELRVEVATDVHLVADGEIKVDDGELALPRVHQGKEGGMEDLDARECKLS